MEKEIKLSEWAKQKGYTYNQAIKKFRRNEIKEAFKTETGSIKVKVRVDIKKEVIGYLRLEPGETKEKTENKIKEFKSLCLTKNITVNRFIIEKSGLIDERRPLLLKLLESEQAEKLIITNINDINIFGKNYLQSLCKKVGCELISVKNQKTKSNTYIKVIRSLLNLLEE